MVVWMRSVPSCRRVEFSSVDDTLMEPDVRWTILLLVVVLLFSPDPPAAWAAAVELRYATFLMGKEAVVTVLSLIGGVPIFCLQLYLVLCPLELLSQRSKALIAELRVEYIITN